MLDPKEESVAAYLTQEDVDMVQIFVDENIIAKKESMIAKEIFAKIKDRLSRVDMPESVFMGGLSANVRGGYIVGIEGRRRVGYVVCDRVAANIKPIGGSPPRARKTHVDVSTTIEKVTTTTIDEVEISKPKEIPKSATRIMNDYKHAHHVWIDRKEYRVKRSFKDIEMIVCDILQGKKNENGSITFNGNRYSCEDCRALEKIMAHFLGAIQFGESDPVLNDDSNIPVELRIAS